MEKKQNRQPRHKDTQTGIDKVDRYIRAAASKILKTEISKDTTMKKIEQRLMNTNIAPETILYKISQDTVRKAQRKQTDKARQRKGDLEILEDKIQKSRTA